jgi:hypothetical protein
MGVKKGNVALARQLQQAIDRHQPDITKILQEYNVPLVPRKAGSR